MTSKSIVNIAIALNEAKVKYVIVGGVAVIYHGYMRLTLDVDLVLKLDRENVLKAMQALEDLSYRPVVPVNASEFADNEKRKQWKNERNMVVFSLRSDKRTNPNIDVFIEEPFDVDRQLEQCSWSEIAPGVIAPIVSLEELMRMKRAAGRPKDLLDLEQLEMISKIVKEDG